MTTGVTGEYSDTVRQAFNDWNERRAYVDNGRNYRVRPEPATPTHHPRGKIAPWNKEVKRLFPSCAEFHAAAQRFKESPSGAQPAPETGGEWRVFKFSRKRVLNAEGLLMADAQTEELAAQIVSDHSTAALVPGLVEALRELLVEAEVSTVLWQQSRGFVGTVQDAYDKGLMPEVFKRARTILATVPGSGTTGAGEVMIDYKEVEGLRGSWKMLVKLDGKIAGEIRLVTGGFAYFPKGAKRNDHGQVFKTVREVQRSLEDENEEQP